ncbi:MAG TPA: L,D-transpeptidase family protein [Pyrinomonadaceae bacterium]|nr:L,D-transpeptidase family protein [Pyrinomonadaceae bacterium]
MSTAARQTAKLNSQRSFLLGMVLLITAASAGAQQPRATTLTRTQIRECERRLAEMGYWTGRVDGLFDSATQQALIAFQKWEGREITGQLTLTELEAIHSSAAPKTRDGGYAHAEVDIDRQLLLLVDEKGNLRVLPVSTGNDQQFQTDGQMSIAYTPRGRFVVYDKGIGWETGPLGSVYYANYITGGVAIHGYESVPTKPASHGCIRIPMFAARVVSRALQRGTIVLVYDKVTFVSAKEWLENPQLKEAALRVGAAADYTDYVEENRTRVKQPGNKKPRLRVIRT